MGSNSQDKVKTAIAEQEAIGTVLRGLEPLEQTSQVRVLDWVQRALGLENAADSGVQRERMAASPHAAERPDANEGDGAAAPTPKEFMAAKRPTTFVDRAACLAYYLQKYRSNEFAEGVRTRDISALNQEAAQPRFSNPSQAVKDAVSSQLLVPTGTRGVQQLSPRGEAIVDALPDPDAVKEAKSKFPITGRTGNRRKSTNRPGSVTDSTRNSLSPPEHDDSN